MTFLKTFIQLFIFTFLSLVNLSGQSKKSTQNLTTILENNLWSTNKLFLHGKNTEEYKLTVIDTKAKIDYLNNKNINFILEFNNNHKSFNYQENISMDCDMGEDKNTFIAEPSPKRKYKILSENKIMFEITEMKFENGIYSLDNSSKGIFIYKVLKKESSFFLKRISSSNP
ncbi:hypothetical protein [Tenacibaculum sp. M341]|uniref:hypothetical protein n=1 Tax=Tenacibaculum sp. M341 TaxID=2530339 RepID=UPI00104B1F7D|nr:hypothetical protein [Tenacibaculum sp. M341]TCI94298.1 hypothetical protein EYW44_02840 [Tenacibaculum sp. M341]